tara:strand:+ start:6943 stop:7134 length:192 start_codon:yes stop_codon:yes gene_type:complete
MGIIDSGEFSFSYDRTKSIDENFTQWRLANHEERSAWGDALLTREEAKDVFESLFTVKVSVDK